MRKNILILGHSYATQFIDIYNQYTRLFDKNQYNVTVAFLTGEAKEEVQQRILAEQVIFLNFPKKKLRMLKIDAIRTLLSLCRTNKYQIVICHRYKPTYIMMWVAQLCRIPALICVLHELNTMTAWGRKFLVALLRRKNMLFAGVSNAVRDDIRKSLSFVPAKYIITLYNMIDVSLTEPMMLNREDAKQDLFPEINHANYFVFGNLARLAPNKDQLTLVKAFAKIKATCQNAKLVIVGNGVLENDLKDYVAKNDLSHDVIFTGYVSGAFRYLKALDCFVLSSIQEAFGRVLLEAMIAKLPIIATRVNGIPEVLRHTNKLIEPKNIDQLASAMQEIYHVSNSQREQLGNISYLNAIENFSIPCFQKNFWQLSLIQQTLEN